MTGTSKTLWSKTDMSNLRLINETTASSVASLSITDIFSADFDIYKLTIIVMVLVAIVLYMLYINSVEVLLLQVIMIMQDNY